MSGMQIVVTPQGRAALVNAQNTGTLPVTISQIGVTSTAFDPTTNPVTLPGELKRLATFAGEVVADDTIHVTMQDESEDVYTLRGVGLYLQDGTLFAVYGQASAILEKSAQAMVLTSMDIRFVQVDATSLTFGDSSFSNPPATTERVGVVELATTTETATGDDQVRAVTPFALRALLNARFGAGSASDFVKTLLTAATAGAFRTLLAIKTAALKDEGAGNGLDADLLDGQHGSYYRQWANLTGVPASFTPSAHQHHADDITAGVLNVARIPDLAQSKVTGLSAALALLAPKNAPQFTGGTSVTGTHKIHDPTTGSVVLEIGAGYSAASDGHAYIANRNPSGFIELFAGNGSNRLRVGPGGAGITYNDLPMWHQGNFNPANKLDYRGSLESAAASIGNWNDAVLNGWYRSPPGTPNAPESTQWYMGTVIRHDPSWIEQVVRQFAGDPNVEYFRMNFGGAWSAWQRRYTNQVALDSRYARLFENSAFRDITCDRGNGTGVVFLNGAMTRYVFFDGTKYSMPGAPLDVGGMVYAPGFAQSSSRRYKREIQLIDADEALALLNEVQFVSYNLRADGSHAKGVIAEDLADGPLDFAVKRNESGQPEAVDYQPLFVLAARSLQAIAARLSLLEQKVA